MRLAMLMLVLVLTLVAGCTRKTRAGVDAGPAQDFVTTGQEMHFGGTNYFETDVVVAYVVDGNTTWAVPALRDGGSSRRGWKGVGEPEILVMRPDLVKVWLPDGGLCR